MQQRAQLSVLGILQNRSRSQLGERLLVLAVRRVRREVIYVDALVGAAGRKQDLLRLAWNLGRGWRDGQAANGRAVGAKEERIGKFHGFLLFNGSSHAMENLVVGSDNYLNRLGRRGCGC